MECYPGLLVTFVLAQKPLAQTRVAVLKAGCPWPSSSGVTQELLKVHILRPSPGSTGSETRVAPALCVLASPPEGSGPRKSETDG